MKGGIPPFALTVAVPLFPAQVAAVEPAVKVKEAGQDENKDNAETKPSPQAKTSLPIPTAISYTAPVVATDVIKFRFESYLLTPF